MTCCGSTQRNGQPDPVSSHRRECSAWRHRLLVAAFGALLSWNVSPAWSAKSAEAKVVRDPHYGEVLFQFFQEKYFAAITHLMVANKLDRFPHHTDEAELLRGGMYLSYGLHWEAGEIFERLIAQGAPPAVQDRAWFYLAKIRYQRGYLDEAVDAMGRVRGPLPGELEDERIVLKATLFMLQEKYVEAIEVLKPLKTSSPWAAYGRYNLGVALVKAEQTQEGVELLEKVGQIKSDTEELKALRDKANVALGFVMLQNEQPTRAKAYLQEVRLQSLLANKALLGVGWALSAEERYKEALTPWLELRKRSTLDPAVQESMLAVPYAFGQLKAYKQAIQYYEDAAAVYVRETERLDAAISAIQEGKMTAAILRADPTDEMGWFWRLQNLPVSPETYYLLHLLASHEFQEAFKNYRDVRFLMRNLDEWTANIDVFDDMLANRRNAYTERLPRIRQGVAEADAVHLKTQRDDLAKEIARVEAQNDVFALANAVEHESLVRLRSVEARLRRLGKDADLDEARERYQRLRGVLFWRLNDEYIPRLWKAKEQLQELDEALAEHGTRRTTMRKVEVDAPREFEGFNGRILSSRGRIAELRDKLRAVSAQMEIYLQKLAVAELQRQQERLGVYITQIQFAVAQVYDHATTEGGGER